MRINADQALQRLNPTEGGSRRAPAKVPVSLLQCVREWGADRLFVFQRQGSVIISPADDMLPPVLAACDGADDDGQIPPAYFGYIDDLAKQVRIYQAANEVDRIKMDAALANAPAERQSIAPMVNAQWGQGAPYNTQLDFGEGACMTGCNNTAIAQILYYWGTIGYLRGCPPTPEYKTKTRKYQVKALPSITVFDYANLFPTKAEIKRKTARKKAVAQMMEYIGKACRSNYAPSATSASPSNAVAALKQMKCKAKLIKEAKVGSAEFEKMLYSELTAGRPVYMCGFGGEGGHAFVVDGYDAARQLYHVNWGYDAKYDGWFAINALFPGTHDYNANKQIITIDPQYLLGDANGDGKINMLDVTTVINKAGKDDTLADVNSDGKVDMADASTIINIIIGK